MLPMSELQVLKGLQSSICGIDLDHPHAVEMALALGAQMEACAGRIINERCPVTQAWAAICNDPFVLYPPANSPEEHAYLKIKWDAMTPEEQAHCQSEMYRLEAIWREEAKEAKEERMTEADQIEANWIARAQVVQERRDAMDAERIESAHVHPGFAPILAMVAPLGPLTQAFVERGKHV